MISRSIRYFRGFCFVVWAECLVDENKSARGQLSVSKPGYGREPGAGAGQRTAATCLNNIAHGKCGPNRNWPLENQPMDGFRSPGGLNRDTGLLRAKGCGGWKAHIWVVAAPTKASCRTQGRLQSIPSPSGRPQIQCQTSLKNPGLLSVLI